MTGHVRQQGTVVIVAMLVVALAATAASLALQHQDVSLRQLETSRDYEQGRWILKGGAHWARAILAEDARSTAVDHAGELWAGGLPVTQVEGATLSGRIEDQQGLFNLANLRRDGKPSAEDIAALARLLILLRLDAGLAGRIASAQPVTDLGELSAVPGCDDRVLARLRPFVTVLPRRTTVNVNTARPEVLAAILEGLTLPEALVLAEGARTQPLRRAAELQERLPRRELEIKSAGVGVASQYFRVQGRVTLGKADVRLEALIERQGEALPPILWLRTS